MATLVGANNDKVAATTLEAFATRFVEGHVKANRQKPSSIAQTESILRVHLVPHLGATHLDAITTEDIQQLKLQLRRRAVASTDVPLTLTTDTLPRASWACPQCGAAMIIGPIVSLHLATLMLGFDTS